MFIWYKGKSSVWNEFSSDFPTLEKLEVDTLRSQPLFSLSHISGVQKPAHSLTHKQYNSVSAFHKRFPNPSEISKIQQVD